MKRLFLPMICVSLILLSCKKDSVIEQKQPEIAFNWQKHDITPVITSQAYNASVYDSCTGESITFSGLETYKLWDYADTAGEVIKYEIDLSGVTGTGDSSGTYYSGGGTIVNFSKVNYETGNVIGRTTMRIVYKSNKDKIVFRQKALFIQKADSVIVNFDSGYIESCKLK